MNAFRHFNLRLNYDALKIHKTLENLIFQVFLNEQSKIIELVCHEQLLKSQVKSYLGAQLLIKLRELTLESRRIGIYAEGITIE